jgi:hypothetical protein
MDLMGGLDSGLLPFESLSQLILRVDYCPATIFSDQKMQVVDPVQWSRTQ